MPAGGAGRQSASGWSVIGLLIGIAASMVGPVITKPLRWGPTRSRAAVNA